MMRQIAPNIRNPAGPPPLQNWFWR